MMHIKQLTTLFILVLGSAFLSPVSFAAPAADKASKERSEITQQGKESLEALYKVQPSARKAIQNAAGYAVFNQFGMKIMVAGGGSGKGYAYNQKSKKKTYMKMAEVQAGLGFGIKKFTLVWVFENEKALNTFVNSGWELGAQTNATAVTKGKGMALEGAISVSPGVWIYQMTKDGLSLELTVKGTKYYKDKDLN